VKFFMPCEFVLCAPSGSQAGSIVEIDVDGESRARAEGLVVLADAEDRRQKSWQYFCARPGSRRHRRIDEGEEARILTFAIGSADGGIEGAPPAG
jgi:hypothetical protein